MSAYQKGSITASGHRMLRAAYGEERWAEAVSKLGEEDRRLVSNVEMSVQYPLRTEGALFQSLFQTVFAGDRSALERDFRALGRKQADNMLEGIFSVFARIVSPSTAFARAGSMVAATYTGVTSRTEPASQGNGGVVYLIGLGDAHYLAPWICGWMERAIERFGGKDARVRELAWERGESASDELAFDMRWS